MADNSHDLLVLNERLQTYDYRSSILYFQVLARRFNSRLRFLLNGKGKFHLSDCFWSLENVKYGPDTCHCRNSLTNPEAFFENRMKYPEKYFPISDLRPIKLEYPFQDYKPLVLGEKDESLNDFYRYRVLDFENAHKWYDIYKTKTNALRFRLKVREMNVKDEIDAVYNSESKEWHLTDCMRSVAWELGHDTCFCHQAMSNPWKYLKTKYNYIDWQKIEKKKQTKIVPQNFKTIL